MNAVNWFEIPVHDIDRAKTFYENILDVKLTDTMMGEDKMAMFPYQPGDSNSSGTLVKGKNHEPAMSGTKIYFDCENVDVPLSKVEKEGGKVVLDKTNIGEFGNIGLFMDTEGNLCGLHSFK